MKLFALAVGGLVAAAAAVGAGNPVVSCPPPGSRSWSLMHRIQYRLLVTIVTLLARSSRFKDLEIVVLPHQLTVVRRQIDRTIIWNQRQLHWLVIDYIDHDNRHRPHRALRQRPAVTCQGRYGRHGIPQRQRDPVPPL